MTLEEIRQEVQNASLVLVGLGEELKGDLTAFYRELAGLLEHKDYFIVTLKDREGLEAAGKEVLHRSRSPRRLWIQRTMKAGRNIFTGCHLP